MRNKQVHADRGSVGIKGDNNHVDLRDQRAMLLMQMVYAAADPSPPPYANSPHLSNCRHCGRRWVSTLALFCPLCGYSAQADRAAMRRRVDARDMLYLVSGLSIVPGALIAGLAMLGATVGKSAWITAGFYTSVSVFALVLALALRQRIKRDNEGPPAPPAQHPNKGDTP